MGARNRTTLNQAKNGGRNRTLANTGRNRRFDYGPLNTVVTQEPVPAPIGVSTVPLATLFC
jgi:hypothetical protein